MVLILIVFCFEGVILGEGLIGGGERSITGEARNILSCQNVSLIYVKSLVEGVVRPGRHIDGGLSSKVLTSYDQLILVF